jgi:mitochondrial import inner membrane translocase subunit TIM54
MVQGKRLGDISNYVSDSIKARRRADAGLEAPASLALPAVQKRSPEQELEGGIVVVGRSTFKEFMHGITRGWSEGLDKVDREEQLAHELANDGAFDEPDLEPLPVTSSDFSPDDEPIPTPSRLRTSEHMAGSFSPLKMPGVPQTTSSSSAAKPASLIPAHLNTPPEFIPALPPLLLVSFTNLVGLKLIPNMLWDFFNERHKTASGSRDGYRLVMGITRPFQAPPPSLNSPTVQDLRDQFDLDFDRNAESYYKSSLQKIPVEIESARTSYYKNLADKLATARALARRDREPTKDELQNPPPTEVELRSERIKKEMRWRSDLEGWDIVKPENQTKWDERLRGVLKVFMDPPEYETSSLSSNDGFGQI